MKILLTGGSGFVGRAAAAALLAAGHSVTVLTRKEQIEFSGAQVVRVDLLSATVDQLSTILDEQSIDVVVHCAGETSDESRMRSLHVDATSVLARAAAGSVSHWVQVSSVGALGTGHVGDVSPERPGAPVGEYETTKAESDARVTQILASTTTTLTILLPTIIFGSQMPSSAMRRLVVTVAAGRFAYVGPQQAGAHYIYLDDLADAVVKAVQTRAEGSYVISDSTTVGDLVKAIATLTSTAPPRRRVPEPIVKALLSRRLSALRVPGRAALRALRSEARYSSEPARRALGWAPRVGWREGLSRTVRAWREAEPALRVAYLTTVPDTLHFFRGHITHEVHLGSSVVLISSPANGKLDDTAAALTVPSRGVELKRSISPAADALALAHLYRILKETRPDVLQTATPKAGLLGAIAGRAARVPLIVTGVFGLPQMTSTGLRKALLDTTTRISTYGSDVTWCDSPSMAGYVRRHRLAPPRRVAVVGDGSVSGVDTTNEFSHERLQGEGQQIRQSLNIPDEAQVIGFVGRHAHDKGITELAEAWAIWRERHPQAHLLLVGPVEDDLQPVARRLLENGPRQHWTGPQFPVAPWFAAMDVFVMPSYREGFCATNIEAAAMGVPVVATRIPGCVDSVVDGTTGMLVPVRDARALADAVTMYLENPSLARAHGLAGRERSERAFSPARLENELSTLYREQLAKK